MPRGAQETLAPPLSPATNNNSLGTQRSAHGIPTVFYLGLTLWRTFSKPSYTVHTKFVGAILRHCKNNTGNPKIWELPIPEQRPLYMGIGDFYVRLGQAKTKNFSQKVTNYAQWLKCAWTVMDGVQVNNMSYLLHRSRVEHQLFKCVIYRVFLLTTLREICPRNILGNFRFSASAVALSGKWVPSLQSTVVTLCFSNDVCSATKSCRTKQRRGFMTARNSLASTHCKSATTSGTDTPDSYDSFL